MKIIFNKYKDTTEQTLVLLNKRRVKNHSPKFESTTEQIALNLKLKTKVEIFKKN